MLTMLTKYEVLLVAILLYVIVNTILTLFSPPIKNHNTRHRIKPLNIISTTGNVHRFPESLDKRQNEIETYKKFDTGINVEIWGKAAISMYLWEHILRGKVKREMFGMKGLGSIKANGMTLNYKHGPWFIQSTVPDDVEHLILVLNGRVPEKIVFAKQWLDYLHNYKYLSTLIVMLHANEECDNDWILPYMRSNHGKIDAVFLTYDSHLVDDKEFFQWPLGVASYRGFRNLALELIDVKKKRNYICNFVGTIYENSTRSKLEKIVSSVAPIKRCPIVGRKKWTPEESDSSAAYYQRILQQSDTTLCPVGQNAECYRIYEALSSGSMPIVEDRTTPGSCDENPFRLLKKHNAPFYFIKDWGQLPSIIKSEMALSQSGKKVRRRMVLTWYKKFKENMKETLLSVLKSKMYGKLKNIGKEDY